MVRSFEERAIPPDVVELILRNAVRAPAASNIEGWAFLVLEGPDETARFLSGLARALASAGAPARRPGHPG